MTVVHAGAAGPGHGVRRVDLVRPEGARWLPTRHSGDGVLVLAGSSGRIDDERARLFAGHGCLAESVRWFGGDGQSAGPWEVPLETFTDRLDALAGECDRVWIVGTSFGAEAALATAARAPGVAGVVAFAPSDVVWAGYDRTGAERSHWTWGGVPLPFVPIDPDGWPTEAPPRFSPVHERSRLTFADRVGPATIEVERIARVVVVAGGDDEVWPSTVHAENVRRRRAEHGVETVVVAGADAGHRAVLPGESVVRGGTTMRRGGTEAADRELGARAWTAITTLLASAR
ncbi:pimeloyl-ACP methyl ester carboxylesterase [Frigoribacterium sp. PvP054]|uniref:acyl-CoA thioester hydrolase/BAAT C-terminal domain-containing protein n=1 Tax=Frigoribacterium sp. PvP054 TaxID=3156438 RepID=UPI0033973053